MSVAATDYHQLLLSGQGFNVAQSTYQIVPPLATIQQRQPSYNLPRHHTPLPLFVTSDMAYIGQALLPTPQGPAYSSAPAHNSYHSYQLQAWSHDIQQQQRSSQPAEATQQQLFEEYTRQQNLQAGSSSPLSSSRASIDRPTQHLQAGMYSQISPTQQHHSPQPEYIIGTQQQQPQQHHHHSLPVQPPSNNIHSSDNGESFREREQGGAPNMVGFQGMPEPAPRPKGPKLKFTGADDALLIELKEGKNLTWKQIADFFPGRSSGTLQVRYCTKLKAKTTVWTDEMVHKLRNALAEYEQDRWRIISSKVGNGFSSSACHDKAVELEIADTGRGFLMREHDDDDDYNSSTQQ
ncbi:hypothetical protein AMS68_004290 [Peltaster fructicola]|uniref:Myb-like domain-containing protein n=1 Tax=Peltaster fructicola TaxID=286661 RepID=A0A6H0XVJ8_9PEZI|nr:hypothetical protein AMS68_004290 [Peltaster fructicola]